MIYSHTTNDIMAKSKIAITIESKLLSEIDELVALSHFPNRSRAIEVAVEAQLDRVRKGRLAREVAKLDHREEQALANEGLSAEAGEWPVY
jgi:metal-responsive CopG/Arc/MetJ family transcriptional regulator